uniref:Uncharacterized protein n=1 Tax=Rhizophora mucronata TaxID=61149 RepID=A0A2P2P682_RHIMU
MIMLSLMWSFFRLLWE